MNNKEFIMYLEDFITLSKLKKDDIFVLGCSTSEILGNKIGSATNLEIGREVIEMVYSVLKKHDIYFAVQCCEHLNRALVVESNIMSKYFLDAVNVVPTIKAGGAIATAAWEKFDNPIVVEYISADAGIDIGDTEIGMHIKFVQVPFRHCFKLFGNARVTGLYSRLKYIGGERAQYTIDK
ncbi:MULTISPECIES: TIGR01440 family protein [unclassified Granulicatella]|uniref:TIGR01440 family protein n=1 Tax=unclassified Granulicatella TaxID=2630493 RepID=UPI001D16EDFE|nr:MULTISPECIES: TIGR01440 family protein [unclassified Granulicatella]